MDELSPGLGVYNATKVWEVELMTTLSLSEAEYTSKFTIKDRARMIAAIKLPKFMSALEEDRAMKDAKKKNG